MILIIAVYKLIIVQQKNNRQFLSFMIGWLKKTSILFSLIVLYFTLVTIVVLKKALTSLYLERLLCSFPFKNLSQRWVLSGSLVSGLISCCCCCCVVASWKWKCWSSPNPAQERWIIALTNAAPLISSALSRRCWIGATAQLQTKNLLPLMRLGFSIQSWLLHRHTNPHSERARFRPLWFHEAQADHRSCLNECVRSHLSLLQWWSRRTQILGWGWKLHVTHQFFQIKSELSNLRLNSD